MKYMRSLERSVMIMFALLALLVPQQLHAHEFETGHIERSIDVIVRGDKVAVRYSIGLADETIVNWLVKEGGLDTDEEKRFRKSIADYESDADSAKSRDAETKDENLPNSGVEVNSTPAEPLEFQTELLDLLKDKLASVICKNLELAVDDMALEVVDPAVSTSPRHHVAMEITFMAKLAKMGSAKLSIIDKNFLEFNDIVAEGKPAQSQVESAKDRDSKKPSFVYFGNIRLACRVKGDAVQLNSNVASVLARAQPVELAPLDFDQRVEAATIVTKIGFATSTKR